MENAISKHFNSEDWKGAQKTYKLNGQNIDEKTICFLFSYCSTRLWYGR